MGILTSLGRAANGRTIGETESEELKEPIHRGQGWGRRKSGYATGWPEEGWTGG
jgi:hypothetical protein